MKLIIKKTEDQGWKS